MGYWEKVCEKQKRQTEKGLRKYGHLLEEDRAGIADRLNHLEEELIDGLMYIEWVLEGLSGGEDDGR